MRRVEPGRGLAQRIDDHHRRSHGTGTLECTLQRVGKQDRAEALTLLLPGDCQPTDQGATDERIAGTCFLAVSGTSPWETAIAQSV